MNDESTVRQFPDSPADEAYHGLADDVVRVKRVPPCWPVNRKRQAQRTGGQQ